MIKHTSGKATPSMVNMSQEEHLTAVKGINTGAAVTDLTTVNKAINFEMDSDGTLVLRKPLIKFKNSTSDVRIIYDKKHTATITSEGKFVTDLPEDISITVKWTSWTLKSYQKTVRGNNVNLFFALNGFNNYKNYPDHTLFTIQTSPSILNNWIAYILDNPSSDILKDAYIINQSATETYPEHIYRFLKFYRNIDNTNDWTLEIIHTEFNSLTSSMDEQGLEANLLNENPYAIRDLYDYGSFSTTKILAYIPQNLSNDEINNSTIYSLTEKPIYNNAQSGFRMVVSGADLYLNKLILKAMITTLKNTQSVRYYACWEYSADGGITWNISEDFLKKFENKLVSKHVVDLTSAEFDKIIGTETLTKSTNYVVEKQLIPLENNYSILDYIKDRPDVIMPTGTRVTQPHRFTIYVDTNKEFETNNIEHKVSKSYFEAINTVIDPIKLDENLNLYGAKGPVDNINISVDEYQRIVLNPNTTDTTKNLSGNRIYLEAKNDCKIIKVIVTPVKLLDDKSKYFENSETVELYLSLNDEAVDSEITSAKHTEGNFNKSLVFNLETEKPTKVFITNMYKQNPEDDAKAIGISRISIEYTSPNETIFTSTYLVSTTGSYTLPYSHDLQIATINLKEYEDVYLGKLDMYANQYISYRGNTIYRSNVGSNIFQSLNSLNFESNITNVIKWRSYLVIFTETSIVLATYIVTDDTYSLRIINSQIGLSKQNADTVQVILNSIYFKSGNHVYKLVPNLYSSLDTILNLTSISLPIDKLLLEDFSSLEYKNLSYATADKYYLFLTKNTDTYCFIYDLTFKTWMLNHYPLVISDIETSGINHIYIKSNNTWYYFNTDIREVLNDTLLQDIYTIQGTSEQIPGGTTITYSKIVGVTNTGEKYELNGANLHTPELSQIFMNLPYSDYLEDTLADIYRKLNDLVKYSHTTYKDLDTYIAHVPISFYIDFGQKSSTYTLDKQFLESKLIFATLSAKDTFPVSVDIETDGSLQTYKSIHIDANTDSSFWKTTLDHMGTLNTAFDISKDSNHNGIMKQLFIKYSGKGKTIRQIIQGTSKSKFKFYSIDTRYRILPNKQ